MDLRQLRLMPKKQPATPANQAPGAPAFYLDKDPELTDVQYAIFLLQTAGDVEHALLVQYLYAAYSLPPNLKVGAKVKDPNGGPDVDVTTSDWAGTIAGIAQEEMGHLLSVQFLLRALGGPLSFEREHFPYRTHLYPFPFELEPLTKGSLAKYVYAEMPETVPPEVLTPEKRREITERASAESGGVGLNHVGALYDALLDVLNRLPDSAFRDALTDWQPEPGDWQIADEGDNVTGVKVLPIRLADSTKPAKTLREVALRAVGIIARQGEAVTAKTMAGRVATVAEMGKSHFGRFLIIYNQYRDDFFPALPVARNPNTTPMPPDLPMDPAGLLREQHLRLGRISNKLTLLWARLFNVRYRILLTYLAHYVALRVKGGAAEEMKKITAIRNQLLTWIFDEMDGRNKSSIQKLAKKLAEFDQTDSAGRKAGAPFETPFTFALPDLGVDRWQLHKELYKASGDLVAQIPGHDTDAALKQLTEYEAVRIKFIQDRIDSNCPY